MYVIYLVRFFIKLDLVVLILNLLSLAVVFSLSGTLQVRRGFVPSLPVTTVELMAS